MDDHNAEGVGSKGREMTPATTSTTPYTAVTGLRENETSRNTGCSSRQNAATRGSTHTKGRMGDCPLPRKETTTQWNVTQG